MTKRPYVIYAPYYSKSAGCRVLYKLGALLEEKGFQVYMYAPPSAEYKKCTYLSHREITDELRQNAIIVYPETVVGNPLQFQNVVRYVLYYPGLNGGTKTYHESEVIYTFFEEYDPGFPVLFISTMDETLFYKDETPKTVDSYFVYKNGKWKEIPEFSRMVEINMKYPATRPELADLLHRTKNFYSYDAKTLLLNEAAACGCNVYIVTEDGFEPYTGYEEFLKSVKGTDAQLTDFIEHTQKMNYQGTPEPIRLNQKADWLKSKVKYYFYKYLLANASDAERHYYLSNRYMI